MLASAHTECLENMPLRNVGIGKRSRVSAKKMNNVRLNINGLSEMSRLFQAKLLMTNERKSGETSTDNLNTPKPPEIIAPLVVGFVRFLIH